MAIRRGGYFLYYCSRVLRLRRNRHWHKEANFDSLLCHAGLGQLGKRWIVRDGLTGLTGSSTRARTGCTDLQLIGSSVADCQALNRLSEY